MAKLILQSGGGERSEPTVETSPFAPLLAEIQELTTQAKSLGIAIATHVTRTTEIEGLLHPMSLTPKTDIPAMDQTYRLAITANGVPMMLVETSHASVLEIPEGAGMQFQVHGIFTGSTDILYDGGSAAAISRMAANEIFATDTEDNESFEKLNAHKKSLDKLQEECQSMLANGFESFISPRIPNGRINIYEKVDEETLIVLSLELSADNQTIVLLQRDEEGERKLAEIEPDPGESPSLLEAEITEMLLDIKTYEWDEAEKRTIFKKPLQKVKLRSV